MAQAVLFSFPEEKYIILMMIIVEGELKWTDINLKQEDILM